MHSLETTMPPKREQSGAKSKLSDDVFGALINLSGRRRFTSQRVVLYAVLASLGHDGAIETAHGALALFRDAHITLLEGKGDLPGIFCDQLQDAYFGSLQGDKSIRDFIHLAACALDAIKSDTRQAPALLDELVRSATPLLAVLNGLTLVYEEQSKRHAITLKKQLLGMMTDIKAIAKQARMVSFDAQIVAARAGDAGKEFSVVASRLTDITSELDDLMHEALSNSTA